MLSHFYRKSERDGQTDGRTDGQTELLYQYRVSLTPDKNQFGFDFNKNRIVPMHNSN